MNTLVIGASLKPVRYSYQAIKSLKDNNFKVYAIGTMEGKVEGIEISTGFPEFENIHTILLYINPQNQKKYYDYIIELKPKRIIFNPGTVNNELINIAKKHDINVVIDCALNMILNNSYLNLIPG